MSNKKTISDDLLSDYKDLSIEELLKEVEEIENKISEGNLPIQEQVNLLKKARIITELTKSRLASLKLEIVDGE